MNSSLRFYERYKSELKRLQLDEQTCPYGAMSTESAVAEEHFLSHLRSLAPGATWRDVFPDLPAHWDLDDPESWTHPYRPMYSFDYQTLPTGPVCMAAFSLGVPDDALDHLLTQARESGFQVHGAGFIVIQNPEWPDRPVRIVLDHTTTEARLNEFARWLAARHDVRYHGVARSVNEQYAPEPGS